MGSIRQGPPAGLIDELRMAYQIRFFVETGTFIGNTAYWASQNFERVFTVEFAEAIYRRATERYGHVDNISFLYGHSREKLQTIVSQLDAPALFWLDAHWSGGQTYGERDECPVLDEIAIINRSGRDSYILIDDARLFLSPPPLPHRADQWPDLGAVIGALSAAGDRYIVVVEDVIVAVPPAAKPLVQRYCQAVNTAAWEAATRRTRTSQIRQSVTRVYRGVAARLTKASRRVSGPGSR